jgi:hypothetical protein
MRIFQRDILNGVAKSIASGLRIFRAYLPTALPMDYATEAASIAPLTRYPHTLARIPALNSSDSASGTEPQFSEDEHSSSSQSSSEKISIASTLVVLSSDEDTGNQSIASRTRFQRARQRTTSTAPLIENDTNDPPPTSQPTDDNHMTDLQDRQRAPLKHLSRCLENRTRIELPMSEILDEAVNGQKELNCSLEILSLR